MHLAVNASYLHSAVLCVAQITNSSSNCYR